MNIAILIPSLVGGGAERVAQIIGNYYVENGNNVYYFIGNTDDVQDYFVEGKIVRTQIRSCMEGEYSDLQRMVKLFFSSFEMRKMKRKYKIDAALSFMDEFNYLNILSRGREKVITRVCTILSTRQDLRGVLYKKDVVRFFYSRADKVVVMSRYAAADMHRKYGIPSKKIKIIPNAVLDRETCKDKEQWQYGEQTVLCVGRLEAVKQQERIIRAFCFVKQKENRAKLVILGKGPQKAYLKRLCRKYQIEKDVIFGGFTDNLCYYLENAKVFVMASKTEGFPNSMIEAMNYGVPVVTTDTPGACREIMGKREKKKESNSFVMCRYGILTPAMPDSRLKTDTALEWQEIILGKAILKVLEDKDVYARYSRRSKERAEMYNINKVIKKWDCILQDVR